MNTIECAVDCYFRLCRRCFTMHDVIVERGGNGKFGLLAFEVGSGRQYHIECGVNHCEEWQPDADDLLDEFDRRFFGIPKATEFLSGYRTVGFLPGLVERIYCSWMLPMLPDLSRILQQYASARRIRSIQIISFRDEILPQLERARALSAPEKEAVKVLGLLQKKNAGAPAPRPEKPVSACSMTVPAALNHWSGNARLN